MDRKPNACRHATRSGGCASVGSPRYPPCQARSFVPWGAPWRSRWRRGRHRLRLSTVLVSGRLSPQALPVLLPSARVRLL